MDTQDNATKVMNDFLKDGDVQRASDILGRSRATIYRYARIVRKGDAIVDRRRLGNNRKYGPKGSDLKEKKAVPVAKAKK